MASRASESGGSWANGGRGGYSMYVRVSLTVYAVLLALSRHSSLATCGSVDRFLPLAAGTNVVMAVSKLMFAFSLPMARWLDRRYASGLQRFATLSNTMPAQVVSNVMPGAATPPPAVARPSMSVAANKGISGATPSMANSMSVAAGFDIPVLGREKGGFVGKEEIQTLGVDKPGYKQADVSSNEPGYKNAGVSSKDWVSIKESHLKSAILGLPHEHGMPIYKQ